MHNFIDEISNDDLSKNSVLRLDLNVPIKDGIILDDNRIQASIPAIKYLYTIANKIVIISHFSRPENKFSKEYSLLPIKNKLEEILSLSIVLVNNIEDAIACESKIVLLENIRFFVGETENDTDFAKKLSHLGDYFVFDAFAVAHRKHASTYGITKYLPTYLGPLVKNELNSLNKALEIATSPRVAILGGAKISTKIQVLRYLITTQNHIIIGGAMANTLFAAKGQRIGKSLYEESMLVAADEILSLAENWGVTLTLPVDIIDESEKCLNLSEINKETKILDIGPKTCAEISKIISTASTVLWNGPMGCFEDSRFAGGTKEVIKYISKSTAYSVAGGGETIAAVKLFGTLQDISYVSTGGGAFLEYCQGEPLPALGA